MRKIYTLFVGLLVLTPVLAVGHYVPGDPIHTGEVDKTSATTAFTSSLGVGSRGSEVTALQTLLKEQPLIYPEGFITGYFGLATQRAILRLQRTNGLEQVGKVGPKTRALLNKMSAEGVQKYAYLVPQIIELNATSAGTNHVYVFWSTNKMTTSELWYATSAPLASTTPWKLVDGSLSLTHAHNINNLATGTTYYFQVKVTDEFGLSATSTERSITTLSQ